MTTKIAISATTPFLLGVPNSQVSQEWIRFLTAVVTIVNNSQSSIPTDQITTLVLTNLMRPPQPDIDDLRRRIKTLEALVRKNPESRTVSASLSVAVGNDNASTSDVYPLWSGGYGGQKRARISTVSFKFNPLTGLLTAKQIVATTGFGCNGKSAQTSFALGVPASDLASVITLANNLRTMSINNGTGS